MDAVPPSPPAVVSPAAQQPPAAHFIAATDIRPRAGKEQELCERASHTDWLYLSGLVALDVGAIALHPALKFDSSQFIRTLGPAFIGLTWGATLGGAPLTRPACDPTWVWSPPPEGDVRARWPLALAMSGLAAATAPLLVGIVTGNLDSEWSFSERSSRLWIAAGSGFIGSFLPYIPALSPRPWRAARELEHLRAMPVVGGAMGTYSFTF